MSADAPLFSVLIPSYNRANFLCQAIKSVLGSTFQNFEVLVSEDHSVHQSTVTDMLRGFSAEPRLRWFAQPSNLGWSRNRNFLVSQARGKFVWLMGDDDLLPPNALERLARFIDRHPAYDVYAPGYEVIDEHDIPQYARRACRRLVISRADPFAFRQVLLSQILPFWHFHPFTYAYRRALGSSFPYNSDAFIGDDLWFLFECLRAGHSIAVIPDVLFQWRKLSAAAAGRSGAQANLSSATNGIVARVKLLALLESDATWQRELQRLFPGGDFVDRFLYDSLRIESSTALATLLPSYLANPTIAPRLAGYRNPHPIRARLRIRSSMVAGYLRLNGWAGALEILQWTWLRPFSRRVDHR